MNESPTASDTATSELPDGANVDSTTAVAKRRRGPGRPFTPGDPRSNTRGRPRKGESFAEKYRKQVERDADELIARHVERAKGAGVVASKEFALAAAYAMGRPVQPYVVSEGESPLTALLTELSALSQPVPIYIEGESRIIDTTDAGHET